MAIVVPIPLSQPCLNVVRVISLFPVLPVFPNTLRASQLQSLNISTYPRDSTQISKGFPHSINLDVPNYDLSSNQSDSTLLNPYPGIVFPLPPNAYAVLFGNQTTIPGVALTSVLFIDTTVCPVEPGFSRLRVDYVTTNNTPQTDYLDMPFWEAWDQHPSEIQQIVDYAKETIQYIQDEIVILEDGVFNALERAQLRALSVSGTLGATQALNTYNPILEQSNANMSYISHAMMDAINFEATELNSKKSTLQSKTTTLPYTITAVTPNAGVFAGDSISVTIDVNPKATDAIYLGTVKLPTTIVGTVLTATLPTKLTYNFYTNLRIGSSTGVPLSSDYELNILSLPKIKSILGSSFGNVVPGSQFILTGTNFGLSKGATTVTFNPSLSANITLWSSTNIAGIVPAGATTGFVSLKTDNEKVAKIAVNVAGQVQTDVFAITPNIVAVTPNEKLQFSATLNNETVQANWSLSTNDGNIGTGNVACGFINAQTGLYTAPSYVFQIFNINIVCNYVTNYGNVYATTSVVVLKGTNTLTITPSVARIKRHNTQLFTLTNNGTPVNNVTWYVNGIVGGSSSTGLIAQSGLYQAPPIVPSTSVFVTGVAASGSATAPVKITEPKNVFKLNQLKLQSKTMNPGTGSASCIPSVYEIISGTVGQQITILDWAQSTNNGGSYYVTAYNQPSCGNQDGIIAVSDGTQGTEYGVVYLTPQTAGFYSIVVYVSSVVNSVTESNQYYYQINIANAASPVLTSATSVCPGAIMTVNGQYFPVDAQIRIAETNQLLQIIEAPFSIDGVNYSMSVMLPNNASNSEGTIYNLYLYSPTVGISNEVEIVIPAGCGIPPTTAILTITPSEIVYTNNQQIQFTSALEISDGTSQDVTTSTIWYVYPTGTNITPVLGGNSTYGTINTNGLYTAPSGTSEGFTIVGQNNYMGAPKAAYAYLTRTPLAPTPPTYSNAPTSSSTDCVVLDITPNNENIAVPGPGVQFTCICNNVTQSVSAIIKPDTWFVNGVAGGDTIHGTINSDGYYVPPEYYPPNDYAKTEIGARYTLQTSSGPIVLNNYAIIAYYQSVATSGNCDVKVVSQINITFGDGRNGYIPSTTSKISLLAGNYLLATYNETLDQNFLPIPSYTSQLMVLSQVSAQALNLASVIYNEGQIYQSSTSGQYTRQYTVVLGICDPTSGLFQSMWDEITVVQPIQNSIPPPPTDCSIHSLPEMLSEHIETKLTNITPIKINSSKFMWAAKGSYNDEKLVFEDVPKLLYFDDEQNFFKAEKIGNNKSFTLKQDQMLACIEKDNVKELIVLGLNDNIPANSRLYVLGVMLDKFQSISPFLTVKSGFNMYEGKNKVLKLNNLLIQWGVLPSDKNEVKFDIPFKSYNLNLSPGVTIQESNSKDFSFTIIDKGATNTWFAVGS